MEATQVAPTGRRTLALVILMALIIVGLVAGIVGFRLALTGGPSEDGTPYTPVLRTYALDAYLSGFMGAGGTIGGMRNPDLVANKGDTVRITVANRDTMAHDFTVDGMGVKTALLSPGASETIEFLASRTGTFPYYCTVPGHRAAGMDGKLVVGEGSDTTGPGPARPTDVDDIARHPADLPPPLARSTSETVQVYMEAAEVVAEIEPGTTFTYWTYNATAPGPFYRIRVGDTVVVHFRNAATSTMNHSVDFHAVTGPGGGAVATQTPPGQETSFTFQALNPGIFVYHCASPHIPTHIAMGMYGLILVEPTGGLPAVDREYYVMQGELYTKWPVHTAGHQEFDGSKLGLEEPTYVVFNGRYQALTGDNALSANVNETVRIYFGVGGPNLISSFHVIGEIFDRVYELGDFLSPPLQSVQTVLVPPGGAAAVEFKVEVPGNYILVDHALVRAIDKGAVGILVVTGPARPEVFDY